MKLFVTVIAYDRTELLFVLGGVLFFMMSSIG